MDQKAKLRQTLRTERRNLPSSTVATWDQQIYKNCINNINIAKIRSLHCYIPMKDWREVDTWPLIKHVWRMWPKITIAAPRILPNGQMESVVISPSTKWGKHATGISEPAEGKVMPPDFGFDVVIVPTLGFDKEGFRLGAGGGFYDRFTPTQPKAKLIGVCYESGFLEKGFPHEAHDVKLDKIITEKRVLEF